MNKKEKKESFNKFQKYSYFFIIFMMSLMIVLYILNQRWMFLPLAFSVIMLDSHSTGLVIKKEKDVHREMNPLAKFFMRLLKDKWQYPMAFIAGLFYGGLYFNRMDIFLIAMLPFHAMVIRNNYVISKMRRIILK